MIKRERQRQRQRVRGGADWTYNTTGSIWFYGNR